ncbi:MAG TPA: hypothetical protein DDW59_08665 [Gammaproteobacteria bacterium]|nr:hypothetical protein [Gammaproteobacteria bacterium]|tara:strand:+ start:439 stop:732 length:294 start_codon:yes stop_codon:yes gene_type:complete
MKSNSSPFHLLKNHNLNPDKFRNQSKLKNCACASVASLFSSSRKITLLAAAAMISGIVPLVVMGYQVAIPFVVLGAVALCASLIVNLIFIRAKALRG